ncbi:MAG: TonB-dependent receptor [Flavobacteriaceae bacterium]|nr:TonB-dependent receptor [Flavobacteriaceae bacterium]
MKNFTLVLALFIFSVTIAQEKNFIISGSVFSEETKRPLEAATVYLERIQDSTLVTYTIADKDGKFVLENKTADKHLNLYISFVGYKTFAQSIDLNSSEINLDPINMITDTNALDEVLVKSRAPITIKKDTLEFNVKSFKTKKDANVEDLLKQLPGVEVDETGKITVNGKDVNKILVNGKPFFGNDPTITTRNLTKDIIEKVQITDTKTKSEAYAGEKGNQDEKTINLTIKEENNKGVFGRVAGGGGTDERYEFAGMVNQFDNDRRISVLAGGNNTNSPGFSFGEIQKMFGRGSSMSFNGNGSFTIDGRSFGGGQGITTSKNAGLNYADKIGELVDVSADYFYAESDSENEELVRRENILPDSRYFTESNSTSYNENKSHSANIGLDVEIDSTFLINTTPSFRKNNSSTEFDKFETSRDELGVLTNQSLSSSFVESETTNFTNELALTKRFGNNGAFLKFNLDNEIRKTDTDDYLLSEVNIFGDNPDDILRDQYKDGDLDYKNTSATATYRLPLKSKEMYLDFGFNYRSDISESKENTFDYNAVDEGYTDFNLLLSSDFFFKNSRNTPSIKFGLNKEKWNFNIKSSYVFRTMENIDYLRPNLSLTRDFKALELSSYLNYRFSPKSSVYGGYNLTNSPPTISQLQPFADVSDPLNIVVGNPSLEPSNNHGFYGGYNAYDFQKGTGFYSHVNFNVRNNQVVTKSTVNEDLVRLTTFANVNGAYDAFVSGSYSKKVKIDSVQTMRYSGGVSFRTSKNINFNNDVEYASKVNSVTPRITMTYTWKDVMEFRPQYRVTFSRNDYDINEFEDTKFLTHNLNLRTTTYLPKHFEWQNDIAYNYNPNVSDGFQKSSWFWNSTLAYSFLKDKATLTLKVYDLLNQNTNARRVANQNFIQDSESTVLERYFMLTFSWKFNTLGNKGKTDGQGVFFMH